jgi:hypothetical protein
MSQKASGEGSSQTRTDETVVTTGTNNSAINSVIVRKKPKDKNKQKKSKATAKTVVKDKSEIPVLKGEEEGKFRQQDTSFKVQSNGETSANRKGAISSDESNFIIISFLLHAIQIKKTGFNHQVR